MPGPVLITLPLEPVLEKPKSDLLILDPCTSVLHELAIDDIGTLGIVLSQIRSEIKNKRDFRRSGAQLHRRGCVIK